MVKAIIRDLLYETHIRTFENKSFVAILTGFLVINLQCHVRNSSSQIMAHNNHFCQQWIID